MPLFNLLRIVTTHGTGETVDIRKNLNKPIIWRVYDP
jgi:hypothetical protein